MSETPMVAFWDEQVGEQKLRPMTQAEIDQRNLDMQAAAAYVPPSASKRAARMALIQAGKFALVQPAIDAITDPSQRAMAQVAWDDSLTYRRDDPYLAMIAAAIGLTDADLDNLFRAAVAFE